MELRIVQPAHAPKPLGPYSHGVRAGDFLYCSGQIPIDESGKVVEGGIREQTRQVLRNIAIILQDQGLATDRVVKVTVFMVDLGEFAAMNEVYGEFFSKNPPARSTVQVSALPRGVRIEIEVVACYSDAASR